MVIVAELSLLPSVIEVAVSVTAAGLGTLGGAVYVTEVEARLLRIPHDAPAQPVPDKLHVTPRLESFCTLAVKVAL